MLGASRTSQQRLHELLDGIYQDPLLRDDLRAAGTGVLEVVDATEREHALRTLWADTAISDTVKSGVLTQLFGDRIPELSQQVVREIINSRWSSERDMTDALEEAGDSLLFMAAENSGELDEVEEELFRFGRTVAGSAELQMALTNPASPPQAKADTVTDLVSGKVNPITEELLVNLAGHLRGRRMLNGIEALSDLAAVRRNRLVAEVTAAAPLTDAQQERLATVLAQIQGRDVKINVTVDPSVVGGITVRVGDEVIDGSIATRIEQARRRLTS